MGTVPGGHGAHALAELEPTGDDWPAPHGTQPVLPIPPADTELLYDPARHWVHALCDVALTVVLKAPAEHWGRRGE